MRKEEKKAKDFLFFIDGLSLDGDWVKNDKYEDYHNNIQEDAIDGQIDPIARTLYEMWAPELRKMIYYLKGRKFLDVRENERSFNDVYEPLPDIKITSRGIDWIREPGWWKQRLNNLSVSIVETSVIAFVTSLIGSLVTIVIMHFNLFPK